MADADSGRKIVSNTNTTVCVQGESRFVWSPGAPGSLGGYTYAAAYTFAQNPGSCAGELVVPIDWIASTLWVYKWTGTEWAICQSYADPHGGIWAFGGGGDTHEGDITFEQQADATIFYSQTVGPPSGPGWYGTLGKHLVQVAVAGQPLTHWEGDTLWSGYTWAAASGHQIASSTERPPQPPWVQEDGTVVAADSDAARIRVPVVGPDGHLMTARDGKPRKVPIRLGAVPPPTATR
jgi:hypothetical protein